MISGVRNHMQVALFYKTVQLVKTFREIKNYNYYILTFISNHYGGNMKKLFTLLIAFVMLFTTTMGNLNTYADANQPSGWALGTITELRNTGLFDDSLFTGYQKEMTRLEFVKFLVRSYEVFSGQEIKVNFDLSFNDTTDIDALKAYTIGLTTGVGNGNFAPDLPMDRQTMVTFVIKLMKLGNMSLEPASTVKFADDSSISSWSKESIYVSKSNNIVAGYIDNTFRASVNATGEIGMVLVKKMLFESVGKSYTANGITKTISLTKPTSVTNVRPVSSTGYIVLTASSNLSSASLTNTVKLSLDSGDSYESVGLYQGGKQIPSDVTINGATVTFLTDYLLPLDTTFTIKGFTANGKRYSMDIRTPKYQSFKSQIDNGNYWKYVEIPANPAKGFNYSYFIGFSVSLINNKTAPYEMLVGTNNPGMSSSSNIFFYEDSKNYVSYGSYLSWIGDRTNAFTVYTTFPRPSNAWEYYTHSLDRDSMLVTKDVINSTNMGDWSRLDLQLKAIMADAKIQMESNGFKLNGKPMLHGFSASSDFANRYSIMYPDTIKAVAISHGTTMPLTTYNGVTLNYPMGVADLKSIAGVTFNKEAYKALPQFWFRGSEDVNDGSYFYDGWDTMGELYRKAFGEDIKLRKSNQAKLLKDAGFTNIFFKEYSGIGHDYSDQILDDLVKFYNSIK